MTGIVRGFAVLCLAVALASCAPTMNSPTEPPEEPEPPETPPPPASGAQFASEGALRWFGCTSLPGGADSCMFDAMGRNVGNGCAQAVRGTIHFFASAAAMQSNQELASGPWSLVPALKIAPNDTFLFSGSFGLAVRNQTTVFSVDFQWDDVPC